MITLGGIGEKPGVVDGHIAIREYLDMTLSVDHDIIDGTPAARFIRRLKELIESGYGLAESEAANVISLLVEAGRPAEGVLPLSEYFLNFHYSPKLR